VKHFDSKHGHEAKQLHDELTALLVAVKEAVYAAHHNRSFT
jgi:hypothetical protein